MPKGALFHLHCLTRGEEEQVFHIENGCRCLSEDLVSYQLNIRELKLCYLVRARLGNKTISILFNITPRSVLKAKQRIKIKLALSATDSLDIYIQNLSRS